MKILALEGEWEQNPKYKTSIRSILNFLYEVDSIDFHHRRVATEHDFFFYLKKAKYKSCDIVYFAFHGDENEISLGDNEQVLTLDEIAKKSNGLLKNKIIHFGSCGTLKTSDQYLLNFKKETGAKIVSGYTNVVDFIDSSIFDIAYFSWLFEYEKKGYIDRRMETEYPGMYERLGFKFLS